MALVTVAGNNAGALVTTGQPGALVVGSQFAVVRVHFLSVPYSLQGRRSHLQAPIMLLTGHGVFEHMHSYS